MQVSVLRKEGLHRPVRLVDVFGIAGECHPAERSDAPAKEWPDIGRNETGKVEGIRDPLVLRDLADVVAIVEGRNSLSREGEHGADMLGDRRLGRRSYGFGITLTLSFPLRDRPAFRQIAVDDVMRACLIGDGI